MTKPPRIDVETLKSNVDLVEMIQSCGVDLQKAGKEFAALCPFHSERTPSFKVTPATQLYYCAGCGAGGDHIQFLRDHEGIGFLDAAQRLAEIGGGSIPANEPKMERRTGRGPAVERKPSAWIKDTAPAGAPACPASLRVLRGGTWSDAPVVASWAYRNRAGDLIGYACRIEFERDDGTHGKDVIPITWQVNTESGEAKWRQGAFDKPRPLYGAELLEAHPDANIILVEGEKAVDAARRMLTDYPVLVLTWPGGCKAVEHADWSMLAGRKVVGWPDCDSQSDRDGKIKPYAEQPGMSAMLRIAEILAEHDAPMRVVAVPEPGDWPNGWDLADGEAEAWDGERVMAELRERLATADEIRERSAAPIAEPIVEPPRATEPEPETEQRKPAAERKKKRPPPSLDELDEDRMPVQPLGYNHGRYYYLARRQRQVHEYQASNHSSTGLLQLAPLGYWSDAFAYGGEMKREHWQSAIDGLMRLCERQGIFDTAIIRGRGCWIDRDRLVINLGNRLIVDGRSTDVDKIDSTMIYEAGPRLAGPRDEPLRVDDARRVLDIAKRFNWEMPASAALLAGWVVLAPLCGAMGWRPHIWLTGGTGTGKTTILNDFVAPLMAGMELQVQGNSTEAGIRQGLRADARPVLFDESEQNDEREEGRVQNILSLIRQSSSESQSRTLKGTTTGKHLEFHVRSMFCLASIQVGIKRQADHTRISVLSLYGTSQVAADKLEQHQSKWLETEKLLADLRSDDDFAGRLMARSVAMFETIRANAKTLIRVASTEFRSQRLGDQYGTLLAGAASLINDGRISDDAALKFIRMFDWSTFHEPSREDESGDCIAAIMQTDVMVDMEHGKEVRTIGELVTIVDEGMTRGGVSPSDAAVYLGRHGLKVDQRPMRDSVVLIANKSAKLQRALRGQPYAADWKSYLKRLPGADVHNVAVRFGAGHVSRAVAVPIVAALPRAES